MTEYACSAYMLLATLKMELVAVVIPSSSSHFSVGAQNDVATNETDFVKVEGKLRCGYMRRNEITTLHGPCLAPERQEVQGGSEAERKEGAILVGSVDFELPVATLGGLPQWLSGKESTCQCRRPGLSPWVGNIPWRRKWQPIQVFLTGEFHGKRNLAGYSP